MSKMVSHNQLEEWGGGCGGAVLLLYNLRNQESSQWAQGMELLTMSGLKKCDIVIMKSLK